MISRAIIQTLMYSDHFSFPLTYDELKSRLIKAPINTNLAFNKTIDSMLKRGLIYQSDNYYHLPGRKSLVLTRQTRNKLSLPQLTRASKIAQRLSKIYGVLAIYLTGSLAMKNSDTNADIDLMVITNNNQLWTTRILLTIYTELLGLRRRPMSSHNSGKVCLNLYLSPISFRLPVSKRSLYTAYELIQAMPLFDPTNTHDQLLSSNEWLSTYLPNYPLPFTKKINENDSKKRYSTKSENIGFIEKLSYWFQKYYMNKKITHEYITFNSAFFHPNNPGEEVIKKLSHQEGKMLL